MIARTREPNVKEPHAFLLLPLRDGAPDWRRRRDLGEAYGLLGSEGPRPITNPSSGKRCARIERRAIGLGRHLEGVPTLALVEAPQDNDGPLEPLGAVVGEHRDGTVARAHVLLVRGALLVAYEHHLRRLVEVAEEPCDRPGLSLLRAPLFVRGRHRTQSIEVGNSLFGVRPAARDDHGIESREHAIERFRRRRPLKLRGKGPHARGETRRERW